MFLTLCHRKHRSTEFGGFAPNSVLYSELGPGLEQRVGSKLVELVELASLHCPGFDRMVFTVGATRANLNPVHEK